MTIVPIDTIPLSEEAPTDDLMKLYSVCTKMEQLCLKENGIGLSAVQVGIPWKLFLINSPRTLKFEYYVNCEYTPVGDNKKSSIEGCLSIKNLKNECVRYSVERYEKARIKGWQLDTSGETPYLNKISFIKKGKESIVFQHEIDHHNNILISEIGTPLEVWN